MRGLNRSAILLASALMAVLPAVGAEGGGSSLVEPKYGTIFWTILTFVLLAFLLGRFAWKPLIGALDARQKSIEDTLAKAKSDRESAEAALAEQKELIAQARRERAEALSAGQRDAEKLKTEILDEARQQREKLLQQTDAQIKAGLVQARNELRSETADLAVRAAEKLLAKNLDGPTQRRLVEDYLADLEKQGSDSLPS